MNIYYNQEPNTMKIVKGILDRSAWFFTMLTLALVGILSPKLLKFIIATYDPEDLKIIGNEKTKTTNEKIYVGIEKVGGDWCAYFDKGYQRFILKPSGDVESAHWMAEQLRKAFKLNKDHEETKDSSY